MVDKESTLAILEISAAQLSLWRHAKSRDVVCGNTLGAGAQAKRSLGLLFAACLRQTTSTQCDFGIHGQSVKNINIY